MASPEDGPAATGRWLCAPLPFYVGPLKQFSSFSYASHVHLQANASFNVLYVIV